jgi:hypothetical protein
MPGHWPGILRFGTLFRIALQNKQCPLVMRLVHD